MNHPRHIIPKAYLSQLVASGKTTAQIGTITGFTGSIVRANLRRYGLQFNRPVPACKVLDTTQLSEAFDLYENGHQSTYAIAKRFGVHQSVIWRAFKRMGKTLRSVDKDYRRYRLNETYFDVIDAEDKAYWLGFLFADGGLVHHKGDRVSTYLIRLSLHSDDRHTVEQLRDRLYPDKDMSIKTNGNKPLCHVNVHSKHMFEALVRLGCTMRKSLTLRFPTSDQVPDHLIHHFVRGYFDGDGCVTWNTKTYRVQASFSLLSSRWFIEGFRKLMKTKGIYMGVHCHKHAPNTYRASTGKQSSLRFLYDYLYRDSTIHLSRKRIKFDRLMSMIKERSCLPTL